MPQLGWRVWVFPFLARRTHLPLSHASDLLSFPQRVSHFRSGTSHAVAMQIHLN